MPHQTHDAPRTESAEEPCLRLGQTDFCRSTGRVARARPEPAGGRPPCRARLPLDALPQPWREWVRLDTAGGAGAPDRLRRASRAGSGRGACAAPA